MAPTRARGSSGKVSSEDPCACPHPGCGKTFSKRSNMRAHAQRAHEGRTFVCAYPGCGKELKHKHTLVKHMRLHEEHPDMCEELRQPRPKLARVQPSNESLKSAIDLCNERAAILGAYVCPGGCNRNFDKHGFVPHLVLCRAAQDALVREHGDWPREPQDTAAGRPAPPSPLQRAQHALESSEGSLSRTWSDGSRVEGASSAYTRAHGPSTALRNSWDV